MKRIPTLTKLEAKTLLMDLDALPRDEAWDFGTWRRAVAKLAQIAEVAITA